MKNIKNILTIIFAAFCFTSVYAQNQEEKGTYVSIVKDSDIIDEDSDMDSQEALRTAEQMPQFEGGNAALMNWLSQNIQYPANAQKNNIQGRVIIQFVVTKTGKIGNVKVVKSVDPDLDREAIRVAKSLPKFIPGKINGQAVDVWYTLPLNFSLQ